MKDVLIFFGFVFIGVIIVMMPIVSVMFYNNVFDFVKDKFKKEQPIETPIEINSEDVMPIETPLYTLLK